MSTLDSNSTPRQLAVTLSPAEVEELQRRLQVAETTIRDAYAALEGERGPVVERVRRVLRRVGGLGRNSNA